MREAVFAFGLICLYWAALLFGSIVLNGRYTPNRKETPMNVDTIKIECEDDGYWLVLETDQPYPWHVQRFRIQNVVEELHDAVRADISPYLRERDEARTAVAAGVSLEDFSAPAPTHPYPFATVSEVAAFYCDPDESAGMADVYDISDPKSPRYHSVHTDHWDNRDKTAGH